MFIQSRVAPGPVHTSVAPQAAPKVELQTPVVEDQVEVSDGRKPIDEKNFSWGDLGKGVAGSVIGGAIEGVAGAALGLINSPRVTYEAVRGVWKSKMLGPVLQATLTPVIIAAGVVAPVFTAIGGLGYGMFEGFQEGAEKNPLAAGAKAIDTAKSLQGKVTEHLVEGIRDLATKEPSSPDEVYEIKLIEGAKGLASSATSAVIDGVGIGASTLIHTPSAYVKVSRDLWKSDTALPLKVGGQFLATAGAALAAPLGVVGGALYGLGKGAYNGYQLGFVDANVAAFKDVAKFNDAVGKALKD